jgi:hypothetical protein
VLVLTGGALLCVRWATVLMTYGAGVSRYSGTN